MYTCKVETQNLESMNLYSNNIIYKKYVLSIYFYSFGYVLDYRLCVHNTPPWKIILNSSKTAQYQVMMFRHTFWNIRWPPLGGPGKPAHAHTLKSAYSQKYFFLICPNWIKICFLVNFEVLNSMAPFIFDENDFLLQKMAIFVWSVKYTDVTWPY